MSNLGYYPNLSQDQWEAVGALKDLIEKAGLNFKDENEIYDLKLLRFLRARKFHVNQTFEMVKNDIQWRQEDKRLHLDKETCEEVLRINPLTIFKYFPTWLQGFDKEGRPVSYKKFGYFETWSILKLVDMPTLVRYHAWETEMALRVAREHGAKIQHTIETVTIVVDCENWSMRLSTSDAFAFVRHIAAVDSDHYPERMGTMLVINAPTALSLAFRGIRPFLDDVTKAKIQILSSRSQWEPALFALVDRDQVPLQYGGTAPDLSPEEAVMSLNPTNTADKSVKSAVTDELSNVFNNDTSGVLDGESAVELREEAKSQE